jgi:hypothetical protein
MGATEPSRTRYDVLLAALGRFAEERRLKELCLLEFEQGVILQGTKMIPTADGYQRSSETHVLSHEEVGELVRKLMKK